MARESASIGDIVVQLKMANRLLVAQLKADGKMRQIDLIALLATSGGTPKDIADALVTTEGTVRATMQRLKKKGAPQEPPPE